jgi:YD repeat-containing protein
MYFDPANPRDHKFAGFGKVDVVDGNNKTTTYYHQGNGDDYTTGEKGDSYYNIGRAYRTDVYDLSTGSSTLVSKNLSLYTTYSYASSSFTYLDSQVSNVYNTDGSYLSSGTKSVYDETKRLIKTTYNYGDIEPFLSFASSTIADKGTDFITTQYQYSNVRPQRLTKETTTDYSGKTIANNSYYYDNLPLGLVDKGAVTSVVTTIYNPDGTINATSTTATTYDPTGNVTQTIDGLNRVTKVVYDSSYFFPVTKIDALNGTTTLTYDPYTLNLLTSKGPDGITYVKETDGLGKVTRSYTITTGGGISDEVKTSYVYGGGLTIYGRRLGSMGASARTLEVYDAYGRLIQSKKETTPDSFSTQDTKYDAQSNIVSTSLPYITNGYGLTSDTPSNGTVVYTYDGLGRVLTKSVFGTTYSYLYGARNLTVTDNAGTQHKKSYFYDANNNLSQVKEYNGASTYTTSYNYTPQNKLSSITDANGNIRNFSYFSNGLLKYQEDTHAPTDTTYTTYSYTYDVLGNLLSKTGPLGTLSYTYDAINRPSARVLGDSTYGTSTDFFPLTYLVDGMRRISTEGASLWAVRGDVLGLVIWGIIVYFIAVRVFKWE